MPKQFYQIRIDLKLKKPLEQLAEANQRKPSREANVAVLAHLVSAKIIEKDFLKKARA